MKKIKVSAPGKLILFGEHAVVHGRPCIVAAVDQRLTVEVEVIDKKELIVEAPDVGMKYYRTSLERLGRDDLPKSMRFVEEVVKKFYQKHKNGGLRVKTENSFSSRFGFGSSAAVTVALAKALHEMHGCEISEKELFDWCYEVVLEVQGVGSGFDIAASLFGGVLYFVKGGKKIESLFSGLKREGSELTLRDRPSRNSGLKVRNRTDLNFELPIVVGYTGVKADTPTLVRQVGELRREHKKQVERWFDEMEEITDKAKKSFEGGDWQSVGGLMELSQSILKDLGVSSVELDRLIRAAKKGGAWGAKLSGAGGGDCMIALANENSRELVEKSIKDNKGEVIKVKLGAEGVRIEK